MSKIIGYRFVVRPRIAGDRFPIDMLRYDSCWPYSQEDVSTMSLHLAGPRSTPTAHISGVQMFSSAKPPTIDRWLSFGWECNHVEVVR